MSTFICPCGATLKASGSIAGKRVRCPKCRAVVTVPGAANSPVTVPTVEEAPAVVGAADQPPPPRRRRRDESDDRHPPRRAAVGVPLLACGGCLMLVGLSAGGHSPRTTTTVQASVGERTKTAEEAIRVDVGELVAAYKANSVAADSAYKGRLLEIKGEVDHVNTDILGKAYLTFKGERWELRSVQCYFKDAGSVADVKAGYVYTIRGRCDGMFGNILLKDCRFRLKDGSFGD